MRRLRALALLVLLPALGGCESEQPAQAGARTVSVEFQATNLAVLSYNVWDLQRDTDPVPIVIVSVAPSADSSMNLMAKPPPPPPRPIAVVWPLPFPPAPQTDTLIRLPAFKLDGLVHI